MVQTLGNFEIVELESVQAPGSGRDFLEGVAVGIAIASLFLGC